MNDLKSELTLIAKKMGAKKIGFTSKERLKGSPPTADISYVMPNAKSAISICIPFDKYAIRAFIAKKDQWPHASEHVAINFKLTFIAETIAKILESKGYEAVARPFVNYEFKKGQPSRAQLPPLSSKYIAVAAGIGWIGWSNILITPEYGAAVLLATVLTDAELEPDTSLKQENWCDSCRLCVKSCPTKFITNEEEEVFIAGNTYKRHKGRPSYIRCIVGCGGSSGLTDKNAKWSSWSPYVLEFPEIDDDAKFEKRALEYAENSANKRLKWALDLVDGKGIDTRAGFDHTALTDYWCCGFCQLICWPKKEDRIKNYKMLINSGRTELAEQYEIPEVRREDPFLPRINIKTVNNNIAYEEIIAEINE